MIKTVVGSELAHVPDFLRTNVLEMIKNPNRVYEIVRSDRRPRVLAKYDDHRNETSYSVKDQDGTKISIPWNAIEGIYAL